MKRDEVLRRIQGHVGDLRRRGVASLSLFGSTVRDEASDRSDVDFLVQFDRRVGLFEFVELQQFLEKVLQVGKVDLVVPGALHEELKDEILREAVRVA